MARNRKRKDLTIGKNKGPKGAIKELAADGKLGKRDITFLAKNYPEIKASTIRNYINKNDDVEKGAKVGKIKTQIRNARGETTPTPTPDPTPDPTPTPGAPDPTPEPTPAPTPEPTPEEGNQFVNDGTTFDLKPGDQLKNVLSGLKIDKNVFKRAFYKDDSGKAPGPLTKKLNQYLDFYNKNSKNTIKVDGEDKNYLQLLKDKATTRMTIDPDKYGRLKQSKYENIKDQVKRGDLEEFNKLSLAEKYDIGSKKEIGKKLLFKQLQKPLTETITEKLDDRLSNFKIGKKGKVKGINFNEQKFDDFSKAGPEISNRVVDAAKALGVRDIAGVSGSSGRMSRIKNISDRIKSKAQTGRSSSSDYKTQFAKKLQYQPLDYI